MVLSEPTEIEFVITLLVIYMIPTLISLILMVGITRLILKNEIFIRWKYWIISFEFILSAFLVYYLWF